MEDGPGATRTTNFSRGNGGGRLKRVFARDFRIFGFSGQEDRLPEYDGLTTDARVVLIEVF